MPLIPKAHEHLWRPVDVYVREDGIQQTTSRCSDYEDCGMEEKRYEQDGKLVGVLYRLRGVWIHPLDLYRVLPLPVEPCPDCEGAPGPLTLCQTCGNVGVVQREAPDELAVNVEPVEVDLTGDDAFGV